MNMQLWLCNVESITDVWIKYFLPKNYVKLKEKIVDDLSCTIIPLDQ